MATPYAGRHRGTTPCRNSTQGTVLERPPLVFNKILRRPLITSGAALATLAATAAGYASTSGHHTAPASYTASPEAVAQAAEQSTTQTDNNAYLASAKNAANQQRAAAAAKATAQAQARVAAQAAARKAAAERAAREQQRQQILAQGRSNPRAVAKLMLQQYGWSGQFGCLDSLWTKESNWNFRATNGSSGAYGIPQALPGSKMAGIAADWRTNPVTQIKWGLQYIRSTYGTPCSAWAHSQATNWY
jgi:hypothetical protein